MPLPHYIRRGENGDNEADFERYQTVYAESPGSIAAPTAGFHFTDDLIREVRALGVEIVKVTLHIGVGTFFLIKKEQIEEHRMLGEYYRISPDTISSIKAAKDEGRRVIAVGTSAVRTLETAFAGTEPAASGYTELFIYPGYRFRTVDALITNFHLPRSTPLLLVSAFAGREQLFTLLLRGHGAQLPFRQLRRRDADHYEGTRDRKDRRPGPGRAPHDRARRGGDAGLHARRHARHREGGNAPRPRGASGFG